MKIHNEEDSYQTKLEFIENILKDMNNKDFWNTMMYVQLKHKSILNERILKKIRLYCEGKSVVDTMELMKLGL